MRKTLRLPIAGMSEDCAGLVAGYPYVLTVEQQTDLTAWLTPVFFQRLCEMTKVFILTSEPHKILRSTLAGWPSQQQFNLLCPSSKRISSPKNKFTQSMSDKSILLELDYRWQVRDAVIFIYCNAEQLPDRKSMLVEFETIRSWCAKNNNVVVLLVKENLGGALGLTKLMACNIKLSGIGEMTERNKRLLWRVAYWHSGYGVASYQQFFVAQDDQQVMRVVDHLFRHAESVVPPPLNATRLVVLRDVVADASQFPSGWIVVDDLNEAVQKARESLASGVLLSFRHSQDTAIVKASIEHLRENLGPAVKIIVREMGQQIRYRDERLIMRVGASGILPKELSFSRCLPLLDAFFFDPSTHHETDAIEVQTPTFQNRTPVGYVTADEFVDTIKIILAESRKLKVQHALVKLQVIAGISALDALRVCIIKRDHDAITAETDCLWLFLYGCRENDVSLALTRIFRLPVGDIFSGDQRFLLSVDIEWEISHLQGRMRNHQLPDYHRELSSLLPLEALSHKTLNEFREPHAGFIRARPSLAKPVALQQS